MVEQTNTRTTGDEALQETAERLTGADNQRLNDGQGAQQQQEQQQEKQYDSVEDYIKAETDRILADSTTTNDITVTGYEMSKGKYRARMSDGSLGARRDTKEEAAASAQRSFNAGEKLAETPEQRAALLALATEAKQFGGRSVNMKMLTDVVNKAMPEAGRTEAFNVAGSIRPAVIVHKGKVATAYGKELNINWEERNDYWRPTIYSPEGVKLTDLRLNDPTQALIEFGLDKDKLIEAYQYGKSQGYLSQGSNRENLLAMAQEEGNQQALDMLGQMPDGSLPFMEALIAGDSSQGYLEKMRIQSAKAGGGVMKSGDAPLNVTQYQQTILGDEAGVLAGFGVSPFASQEDNEKTKLNYLQNYAVYQTVFDNDTDYRPSWNLNSYLDKLNTVYNTPNNNITFGDGGNLQFTFADGSSANWGSQLNNLDVMAAQINIPTDSNMLFFEGGKFNSVEEYRASRTVQPQVTPSATPTATTPTADTDDLEATSTAGTTTDTASRASYIGAQTDVSGTPTATGNVTTQQPAAQQPATQQPTTMPTYGTAPISGTFGTPLQTAGLSAVPTYQAQQTTPPAQQAGFATQQLAQTTPSTDPGSVGVKTVQYTNQYGQSIPVTETNGQPITYVPPGYTKASGAAKGGMMRSGYAEGGAANQSSEDTMLEAKYRIATMNGYQGPKTNASLNAFANASEGMKRKFNAIGTVMANKGGLMRSGFDEGGLEVGPFQKQTAEQTQSLIGQTMQPMQAPIAQIQPQEQDFIPTTAGSVTTAAPMAEAATVGTVQQSQMPVLSAPATMQAVTAAPQVQAEVAQLQAAQGTLSPQAQVQAAQQQQVSMAGMEAAQGQAYMMNNPVQREIQQGELISGVADAQKAAQFNEQIQAATATPTAQATVQGQLEGLMQQFEGGETPAWAAGSMRTAMATLSARGLGASSMAGQAVIQATMEAALPIAQMDAQTTAQFEAQNLSNRQQRAMLAAQQRAQFLGQEFDQAFQARVANSARIGDIANMNFTAEQNIALENSRAANTMNLNNLSNRQAMVMAEAAALSNLDMANLSNRQQAAVQNAQNFMQMDMTNLSNEQQTTMFKAQQNLQALFTDQAAENAAAQFNAASENQTNQFFASLTSQTAQFNAAQQNAMDQFNVNSVNALREFNSEIQQQRDMFNAQNGLVVAQANAQWRQNITTLNTSAQNESNMNFAKTMNAFTATNLDAYWQRERDVMSFAYASAESAADRIAQVTLQELSAEQKAEYADQVGKGNLTATLLKGGLNYLAGKLPFS